MSTCKNCRHDRSRCDGPLHTYPRDPDENETETEAQARALAQDEKWQAWKKGYLSLSREADGAHERDRIVSWLEQLATEEISQCRNDRAGVLMELARMIGKNRLGLLR